VTIDNDSSFSIGGWLVQPEIALISNASEKIYLRPQLMEILVYLVNLRGKVATIDSIHDDLWSDKIVSSGTIYNSIAELRQALAKDGKNLSYVETITKKGYRIDPQFVKQILISQDDPGETSATVILPNKSFKKLSTKLMLISLLALAIGFYSYLSDFLPSTQLETSETVNIEINYDNSIAVMPFVNMSSEKEQEYFSDGLSEDLLNLLAKIPELRVIARTSSFSFKGQNLDIAAIAKKLQVTYVLEGSVRKSGTTLRISAQLIRASDSSNLWSHTYDRELKDLFDVQDELSAAIVAVLKIKLMGEASTLNAVEHKVTPEAHTAYLKGLYYLHNAIDPDEIPASLKYFDDAILLDSNYALAHAYRGMVMIIVTRTTDLSLTEGSQISRMAIDRAIKIDPELAIAYVFRARNRLFFDFDFKGSRLDLELALTLNPNIGEIYAALSRSHSIQGNHQQALLYAQKAKSLDPMNWLINYLVAHTYFYQGDYQQALAEIEEGLIVLPGRTGLLVLKARVEIAIGNYEQALLIINKVAEGEVRAQIRSMAFSKMGDKTKSDEALATFIKLGAHHSAFGIALVYCFRGEIEQCLDWLDRAYKQKDPSIVKITESPFLKPVYQEKRYKELVLKMDIF